MEKEEINFIKECIGWDVGNWIKPIMFWKSYLDKKPGSKILELGAGPGGLSLLFSRWGHDVLCSDIEKPPAEVIEYHRKNDASDIRYEEVNALNISYEGEFDFIIFKSVVGGATRDGHDENREVMMQQIHKALKDDGVLLFAENTKASPLHVFFRKKFVHWGKSWNYCTVKDMVSSMKIFKSLTYKTTGFWGTFGRNESQRIFLSKLDNIFFNSIMPKSWHYIMYGAASKRD